MLWGAGIALILISLFLFAAGDPNPDWGKLWMVRPLLIVPSAGAMGGIFYYVMNPMRYRGGWKKLSANLLSLVVYVIVLWLGTVLGLDGTWWN
ncbi:hypothetical protein JHJ32_05475 [Parapedobacter sp. ISTM3]|nr:MULTISPECIES: hypothetical protein [Parapedobacter]MBK1439427.1 hypothetical protein [Parapedobacter sp. ISTM3]